MLSMSKPDPTRTNWDLSPLLKGDLDAQAKRYREEVAATANAFEGKWRERTDYLEDPVVLQQALEEFTQLETMPANGAEYFYYGLSTSLDAIDSKLKAKENQAIEFLQGLSNQLQFFWLNIGKIDSDRQREFLQSEDLQSYRHWLERQFASAKHRLSEPEEKIMTLKSTPAHSLWVQMTSDMLASDERKTLGEDGKPVKASEEKLLALMGSHKQPVRDEAAKVFNEMLMDYRTAGVNEMNAILANKKIDDNLRSYTRPDESRHLSDDIPSEVVDALVAAVSEHNHLPNRFYKLRAQLLGFETMKYHERAIDYGGDTGDAYKYPQAVELVHNVFTDLDPEFAEIYTTMLANGQIDAFPRKGKRGGAFCSNMSIAHPTYVMLNHTDKLRDVMTIAHEMGHAINSELTRKSQNALNFGVPMSTAEVASTFMEDFVVERLLKEADEETELVLRIRQLDDLTASIFRQVAFYRFEQDLHKEFRESGYVPAEKIGELFRVNLDSYLGPVFEGAHDAVNWWLYVPHFRTFFYVYSYASGLLISKNMQAKVRADKSFIKEVKTFLSAGLSKAPQEVFADMGIDVSDKQFWARGLKEIEQQITEAEQLARKLGKI
jgi:oligoendopeptidase F